MLSPPSNVCDYRKSCNYVPRAEVGKVRRGSLVEMYCVWCDSCVHLRPSRQSQRGPSGLTSQTSTMHGVTRARTYVPRAKVSEVRRGSLVEHAYHA